MLVKYGPMLVKYGPTLVKYGLSLVKYNKYNIGECGITFYLGLITPFPLVK